ncbi:MAG: amidohydrolase family protein [Chloroflexota bacterium]
MIVDVHTHTPSHRDAVPEGEQVVNSAWRPDRAVLASTTWADHDRAQREAGVDVSLVFNIATRTAGGAGVVVDLARVNDSTAEFVRDDPARRIGFCSVDPEHPGVMNELERSRTELGLRGIKLGPNYQDFEPLGEPAKRVYGYAERHGWPILFHQGTSPIRSAPLRYAHPIVMDEIAIAFPELRIVMAHLGHPWQIDTIAVIRKHPHVYADVSAGFYRPWSFWSAMRLATEWNVLPKLLLGSDFPVATAQETIDGLRTINAPIAGTGMPRVPEDAMEAIIHRDALALLGLTG